MICYHLLVRRSPVTTRSHVSRSWLLSLRPGPEQRYFVASLRPPPLSVGQRLQVISGGGRGKKIVVGIQKVGSTRQGEAPWRPWQPRGLGFPETRHEVWESRPVLRIGAPTLQHQLADRLGTVLWWRQQLPVENQSNGLPTTKQHYSILSILMTRYKLYVMP